MTPQQILNLVKKEADVRFGETIERLFSILLSRHAHQYWLKECDCEYCKFINGKYTDKKYILHYLKKSIKNFDNCLNTHEYEYKLLCKNYVKIYLKKKPNFLF